ncbi:MAG: 50S ribosomal protein L19e [Candidatus Helarchaeota archaeon]
MNLLIQRALAARILKVGKERIWIDPEREDDVSIAITRDDIRVLIHEQAIKVRYDKGVSRARARKLMEKKKYGKRRREGSRKGKKNAIVSKKRRWILKIRPQRKFLRRLRAKRIITPTNYRKLYRWATAGRFRSVSHLEHYINEKKMKRR